MSEPSATRFSLREMFEKVACIAIIIFQCKHMYYGEIRYFVSYIGYVLLIRATLSPYEKQRITFSNRSRAQMWGEILGMACGIFGFIAACFWLLVGVVFIAPHIFQTVRDHW